MVESRRYLTDPRAIRTQVIRMLRRGEHKDSILENHASLVAWSNSDVRVSVNGYESLPRICFPTIADHIEDICLRHACGEIK